MYGRAACELNMDRPVQAARDTAQTPPPRRPRGSVTDQLRAHRSAELQRRFRRSSYGTLYHQNIRSCFTMVIVITPVLPRAWRSCSVLPGPRSGLPVLCRPAGPVVVLPVPVLFRPAGPRPGRSVLGRHAWPRPGLPVLCRPAGPGPDGLPVLYKPAARPACVACLQCRFALVELTVSSVPKAFR